MILNFSSADLYDQCHRKYYYRNILRYVPKHREITLDRGSAGHVALARFHATGSIEEALAAGEQYLTDQMKKVEPILPEELPMWERARISMKTGVRKWEQYFKSRNYTVLRTEVEFLQPIPNSLHHCWFFHKLLYGPPDFSKPQPCTADSSCWQPHYITGKTDAVVSLGGNIWFIDHKFSGFKQELFWKQFDLSFQISCYCWGIWKELGIRPAGAIVNKFHMPWINQPADAVDITSDGFIRDKFDLEEFELTFRSIATDIESKSFSDDILTSFRMNPRSCTDYNRECWYIEACKNHVCRRSEAWDEDEFELRDDEYHETAYRKILERSHSDDGTETATARKG